MKERGWQPDHKWPLPTPPPSKNLGVTEEEARQGGEWRLPWGAWQTLPSVRLWLG